MMTNSQQEKDTLQAELEEILKLSETMKQDKDDVGGYIRLLKSYVGAEKLTRQMCLDLIEYAMVDEYFNRYSLLKNKINVIA